MREFEPVPAETFLKPATRPDRVCGHQLKDSVAMKQTLSLLLISTLLISACGKKSGPAPADGAAPAAAPAAQNATPPAAAPATPDQEEMA